MSVRYDIVQFLMEYSKYPCLWKRSDPDFKNRAARDEAERTLLEFCNVVDVKELRKKIRIIRGTYNQERNKVKRSMTGESNCIYKPKLYWYALADSFLRTNEEECESEPYMVITEDEDCLNAEREEEVATPEELWSEPSILHLLPVLNAEDHSTSELQPVTSYRSHLNSNNLINRKRKRARLGTLSRGIRPSVQPAMSPIERRIVSKVDNLLENAVNALLEVSARSNNEFTVFGDLIVSQLQTLPLVEALQLQAEIQSLITNARVRYLQSTSSQVRVEEVNRSSQD